MARPLRLPRSAVRRIRRPPLLPGCAAGLDSQRRGACRASVAPHALLVRAFGPLRGRRLRIGSRLRLFLPRFPLLARLVVVVLPHTPLVFHCVRLLALVVASGPVVVISAAAAAAATVVSAAVAAIAAKPTATAASVASAAAAATAATATAATASAATAAAVVVAVAIASAAAATTRAAAAATNAARGALTPAACSLAACSVFGHAD